MSLDELLKLAKSAERRRITEDGLVCPTACYLLSVAIINDGGGGADAELHDGDDVSSEQIVDLACATSCMGFLSWNPPLYFRHGIYADIGDKVESLLFQYIVEPTP